MTATDWREWLAELLGAHPDDRKELLDFLERLRRKPNFLNPSEMRMIRGVLRMRELKIRDIMLPKNDIVGLRVSTPYAEAAKAVCEWQHSRYPVFDETGERARGILLAKDLLQYVDRPESFVITKVMREPVFESIYKQLDTLLEDFRKQRSHMVIALDEHEQTAGIVTIEDLLEQIVGDIQDESDDEDDLTRKEEDGGYLIKGALTLEEFNHNFNARLPASAEGKADNIGGWLAAELGRPPKQGDSINKNGFVFSVRKADERRVYLAHVKKAANTKAAAEPSDNDSA